MFRSATAENGWFLSVRVRPWHATARVMPQRNIPSLLCYFGPTTRARLPANTIGDRATQRQVSKGFAFHCRFHVSRLLHCELFVSYAQQLLDEITTETENNMMSGAYGTQSFPGGGKVVAHQQIDYI